MPRPLRPVDDGLVYHVINRGNNRQAVFLKKGDFEAFLKTLGELKERKPFELYGYCLLDNHFHLLIRPTGASISRIMQSLLVSHTQRYHRNHRSGGHVWQGRFKSPVIQNDEHLLTVLRYIEANPLRAKIVRRAEEYPWSSYPAHGAGKSDGLIDALPLYDGISSNPKTRQQQMGRKGASADRGRKVGCDPPLQREWPAVWRRDMAEAAGKATGYGPDHPSARKAKKAARDRSQ